MSSFTWWSKSRQGHGHGIVGTTPSPWLIIQYSFNEEKPPSTLSITSDHCLPLEGYRKAVLWFFWVVLNPTEQGLANYMLWPIFTSPSELKIVFIFLKVCYFKNWQERKRYGRKKKNMQLRFYVSYCGSFHKKFACYCSRAELVNRTF